MTQSCTLPTVQQARAALRAPGAAAAMGSPAARPPPAAPWACARSPELPSRDPPGPRGAQGLHYGRAGAGQRAPACSADWWAGGLVRARACQAARRVRPVLAAADPPAAASAHAQAKGMACCQCARTFAGSSSPREVQGSRAAGAAGRHRGRERAAGGAESDRGCARPQQRLRGRLRRGRRQRAAAHTRPGAPRARASRPPCRRHARQCCSESAGAYAPRVQAAPPPLPAHVRCTQRPTWAGDLGSLTC